MYFAVVSLITSDNNLAFFEAWERLEKIFGNEGIDLVEKPHISWQVSSQYDLNNLEKYLKTRAGEICPVNARISGLGVFTGSKPVFYLPVVRTPQIHNLHQVLWEETACFSINQERYYSPDEWIPHITLNRKAISCNQGEIFQKSCSMELRCEIQLNNFAIMFRDENQDGIRRVFPFGKEFVK